MASSRLRFLEEETLILEDKFQQNPRPTSAECKILAERFNVPQEKVRVWYKNRRAKALKKPDNNKRQRTYINSRLANILEETYMHVSIPDKQVRQDLSLKTGLSTLQVKVWFQNRRAKDKKDGTFDQRRNIEVDTLETQSAGTVGGQGYAQQTEGNLIENQRSYSEVCNATQTQANEKVVEHPDFNRAGYVSSNVGAETHSGSHCMLLKPQDNQQSPVPPTHNAFLHVPPPIQISTMQNHGNPTLPVQHHTNHSYGQEGYSGPCQYTDVPGNNATQIQANGQVIEYPDFSRAAHVSTNVGAETHNGSHCMLLQPQGNLQSVILPTHNAFQHVPQPILISTMQNSGNPTLPLQSDTNYSYGQQGHSGPYQYTDALGNGAYQQGSSEPYQYTDVSGNGAYQNYVVNPQFRHYTSPTNAADIAEVNNYNFCHNPQSQQHHDPNTVQNFNGRQPWNNGADLVENINDNQNRNSTGPYPMEFGQNGSTILQNIGTAEPNSFTNFAEADAEGFNSFTNNPTLEDLGDLRDILDDTTRSEGNTSQDVADNGLHQVENVYDSELPSNGLEIPRDRGMTQSEHNVNILIQDDPTTSQVLMDEHVAKSGHNTQNAAQYESVPCQFAERLNPTPRPESPQDEANVDQLHPDISNTLQDEYNGANDSELWTTGLGIPHDVGDTCITQSEHVIENLTQDDPNVQPDSMGEPGTNVCESVPFQHLENLEDPGADLLLDETGGEQQHLDINNTSPDRYDNLNPIPTLSEDEIFIRRLLGDTALESSDNTRATIQSEYDANVNPILEDLNLSAELLRDGIDFAVELAQPEVDITNMTLGIDNADNNDINLFLGESEEGSWIFS
ncbi:unnamed protein product [Hermetia illucens]|uniref:Homeobox domain-containing protein n=1 Tax=Hermetia illucens TaxID=343691 RepID=A0A7R8UGL8_HERIL|nr:unnamed protein product [Hermetia illucens]